MPANPTKKTNSDENGVRIHHDRNRHAPVEGDTIKPLQTAPAAIRDNRQRRQRP